MKLSLIFISGLVLVNAIRDVNGLETQYLAAVPENLQDSAVLSKIGGKNKTVHKLIYRKRRDVSNLDLEYLPPAAANVKQHLPTVKGKEHETSKQLLYVPSSEYLPPLADVKESQIITETPQSVTTKAAVELEGVQTEVSHNANEYLPPAAEYLRPETEVVTQLSQLPSNEYLPAVGTDQHLSEAPTETPQDSEELEVDGYHYKIPDIMPNLFPSTEPTKNNLPTLENGVVETEGPANGDSAILESDGYHYRTIKRRF